MTGIGMDIYPFPGEAEDILAEYDLEPEMFDEGDVEDTFQVYRDLFKQYAKETLRETKKDLFSTEDVQDFILEQDKPYLVLLKLLYEEIPAGAKYPWVLAPNLPQSPHIAVWEHVETNQVFVGCRGTSPFNPAGWQDLADDIQIVFGVQRLISTIVNAATGGAPVTDAVLGAALAKLDVCSTMFITRQGRAVVEAVLKKVPASQVVIGGHSLGGRAAACLGVEFSLSRVVLFNAAAPATNPLYTGLGPERQIHYHIGGDLISSHSDNSKMTLVIANNSSYAIPPTTTMPPMLMLPGETRSTFPIITINQAIDFDLVGHHVLTNFLKSKPSKGTITVDQYDTMWVYWSNHFSQETGKSLLIGIMTLGLLNLLLYFVAWNCPIPNSARQRWLQRLGTFCSNTSWKHATDRINCFGRQTWTKTMALLLGPLVVPFFTAFYAIAFSATALIASVNGLQQVDRITGTQTKRLKWS